NPVARIIWEQIAAPRTLAHLQPDLLHGMAFALPLRWRGPSVVTIYDLSFIRHPERLSAARRLYLRTFTRASARRARRVIAISRSGRDEIHELLGVPLEQIDVAYPGVDESFAPLPPAEVEAFRREKGLPERYILYLGTLEPRKNLDTLIRAYARLPQRRDVKLVLAGGRGWGTDAIFALIEKLGLEGDIIRPGYIAGNELPMWYNAAEIFAYPSVYEGFGMPLVEAMACGVPVITSNTSSLPEAAGPAGVLLPPTDVEAWVGELARLLDDEAVRQNLARRGQQHARKFRWTATARQTADAYHRALSVRG
ncbi:MAG TPA: glycosyltransferase family 1 protein, partial [Aggregatilineales bacterium]|nr:glycosyltransferase family 1 protein [Aggregatilineales bacterium]